MRPLAAMKKGVKQYNYGNVSRRPYPRLASHGERGQYGAAQASQRGQYAAAPAL